MLFLEVSTYLEIVNRLCYIRNSIISPVAQSVEQLAVIKSSCSFPSRGGLKNRVNSGKPNEEIPFSSTVILSEACQRGVTVGRNVQRLEVEDPNQ